MIRVLAAALAILLATGLTPSAGRAEDEGFFLDEEHDTFAADADANVYAGPAPLTVRFTARTINASGAVRYRWSFDDRTHSTEQNPVHTFRRPGWYAVTVDTRDGAGRTYRTNLLLHAWRPRDWARLETSFDLRIVRRSIRELERKTAHVQAAAQATGRAGGAVR
jgi:hypothetical protein